MDFHTLFIIIGKNMKRNKYDILQDISMVLLGNLMIAVSTVCFVIPNKILVGGTAGLAVILNAFFGFQEELTIKILVYVLFMIGTIILGKAFALKTLISTICYPILLSLVSYLYTLLPIGLFQVDSFIASLCSGALIGLGIGLVYRKNGSTGGMDIIPLIIHKYTHLSLSGLVLMVDGMTVLFGAIANGIEAAIYGIISVWICSYIINQTMLLGTQKLKQVEIMSSEMDKINDMIHQKIDRGTTIMKALGGYTKKETHVLMVVIDTKDYPLLIDSIYSIDETAFIIVSDINEVKGRGFTIKSEYL